MISGITPPWHGWLLLINSLIFGVLCIAHYYNAANFNGKLAMIVGGLSFLIDLGLSLIGFVQFHYYPAFLVITFIYQRLIYLAASFSFYKTR